jgi:hypothetical protein
LEAVVGRTAAVDMKLLHDATRRILAQTVAKRDALSSWAALRTPPVRAACWSPDFVGDAAQLTTVLETVV